MRKFAISESLFHEYEVDEALIQDARKQLEPAFPGYEWEDEEIVQHLFECGDLDLSGQARCIASACPERSTSEFTD